MNLYTRLMNKTLMKIVKRISQKSEINPTPEMIQEKLIKDAYVTPFDFALDVRSMFISAKKAVGNEKAACIAITDLTSWFERHLHGMAMTKEEELHRRLDKARRKLCTVRRAMSLAAAKPPGMADTVGITSDSKGPKHPPVTLLNEIQNMLSKAKGTEVQIKITSVLRRHIPNFVPSEVVTLQASDISLQCAEELKEVLERAINQSED